LTATGPATAVRRGWPARLGLDRPELRAWAMYDWANSAFVTTVVAAVFPPYFHAVAASGLPPGAAFTRFGAATTLAILAIGVASPVLGAIADFTATRKRFLLVFLLLGVVSVAGMFHVSHGRASSSASTASWTASRAASVRSP
jgi:UMF1 family MFS transporter